MRFLVLMLLLASCGPGPKYHNLIETPVTTGGVSFFKAAWAFFFEDDPRTVPEKELNVTHFDPQKITADYAAVWLGHATVLVKLKQHWILTDPVFSERLSHWTGVWPKRFHANPIPVNKLPHLLAVVISHDHQDHLDEYTMRELPNLADHFIVPRDVGNYLVDWGVDRKKITELGWWESTTIADITFTCTPARHGSGRYWTDWDQTLWAGWAFKDKNFSVFFAGDTGMFPQFKDIGDKLGPFDLTLMPIGAYDVYWANIHMNPEEALEAHEMVKGKTLLPVHWGTFDLSRHAWDDPIIRFKAAVKAIDYRTPQPGDVIQLKPTTL